MMSTRQCLGVVLLKYSKILLLYVYLCNSSDPVGNILEVESNASDSVPSHIKPVFTP